MLWTCADASSTPSSRRWRGARRKSKVGFLHSGQQRRLGPRADDGDRRLGAQI